MASRSTLRDRTSFPPTCPHLRQHQLWAHPTLALLPQRILRHSRASWPQNTASTRRTKWLPRVTWRISSRLIAVTLLWWIAARNTIREGRWVRPLDLSRDSTSRISVTLRTTGERQPRQMLLATLKRISKIPMCIREPTQAKTWSEIRGYLPKRESMRNQHRVKPNKELGLRWSTTVTTRNRLLSKAETSADQLVDRWCQASLPYLKTLHLEWTAKT